MGCQHSASPHPDHQEAASTDLPPASQSPAPTPLSRASSISTITLTTDTEAPVVVGPPTQQTYEQNDAGLNHEPRMRRSKRQRSPESERSEDCDDGDDYLPYKRAKLSRSSTRTIHAVRKLPIGSFPNLTCMLWYRRAQCRL